MFEAVKSGVLKIYDPAFALDSKLKTISQTDENWLLIRKHGSLRMDRKKWRVGNAWHGFF